MTTTYASRPHYADHLAPVAALLPDLDIALVASYADVCRARGKHRRIVLMQHGIGQSYSDDGPGYPGGRDNDAVGLFLVPNEHAARRWHDAYPAARVEVVGSPRLDDLPRREPDSTGVKCDLWDDFVAAIQTHPRMFASTPNGDVCVAHVIADAKWSEPSASSPRGTVPSPSTTDGDTSPVAPKHSNGPPDHDQSVTEPIRLAMNACTDDSTSSCLGSATSVGPFSASLWRSVGTLHRSLGLSIPSGGRHTLRFSTTTFGSADLVIPCMTAKGGVPPSPTICTTFHWRMGPHEKQNAFAHYRRVIPALAERFHVIGHGHPRATSLPRFYAKHGIEWVPDFGEVCRRADLLAFDNTSAGFEFAATGRPTVVLNAPVYRRDVEHGLRFWDAAHVGVQVNEAAELIPAVERALELRPDDLGRREFAVNTVFGYRNGGAQRAADTIVAWAA